MAKNLNKTTDHFQYISLEERKQYLESHNFFKDIPSRVTPTPFLFASEYSLARYQTPIRNQGDRGTCYAFAGIAALEAVYKRKYNVELDLSEQYAFHINKSFELFDDYVTFPPHSHENNSSFGGGQGGADIIFKLSRVAVPEERFCRYLPQGELNNLKNTIPDIGSLAWDSSNQEQFDAFEYDYRHISLDARLNCKYKVKKFAKLDRLTTEAVENIIANNHELVIDCDWFSTKYNTTTGIHEYDELNSGGAHCILIIGYNKTKRYFLAKNSHGGSDFVKVSYEYLERACSGPAFYIEDVEDINMPPQNQAKFIGNWNMNHDGHKGKLLIRRFTNFRRNDAGEPTKIGNYYRDGKKYDVNGTFFDDGKRLVFFIADTEDKIVPGTLSSGQRFEIINFSWYPQLCAGTTSWNNIPFGVFLSRDNIKSLPSNSFNSNEWIGSWDMNHDGWRGILSIRELIVQPSGMINMNASYRKNTGDIVSVSGTVNPIHKHIIRLTIHFSRDNNQLFELFYHTWEDKKFSGLTFWNSLKYGVIGEKI